jgi:hypothetical protein
VLSALICFSQQLIESYGISNSNNQAIVNLIPWCRMFKIRVYSREEIPHGITKEDGIALILACDRGTHQNRNGNDHK